MPLFQAIAGYATEQLETVQAYLDRGYERVYETSFSTITTGVSGVSSIPFLLPTQEIWDQLAECCIIGVSPMSGDISHDWRTTLSISVIDVRLRDGNTPSTQQDWDEILELQRQCVQQRREDRLFSNQTVSAVWPAH